MFARFLKDFCNLTSHTKVHPRVDFQSPPEVLINWRGGTKAQPSSIRRRSAERRARWRAVLVLAQSIHPSIFVSQTRHLQRSWQLDGLYTLSISSPWTCALVPPRHLGAPAAPLGRILAEKIAFQEAFKKRSNFTSIWTSIFVPLGSIFRPNLGAKIDQKSIKNRSQDAFHFGFHFSSIFDRIFLPTSTPRS